MRVNLPGACGTHFFPGHVTTTTSTDNGCVMGWRLLDFSWTLSVTSHWVNFRGGVGVKPFLG